MLAEGAVKGLVSLAEKNIGMPSMNHETGKHSSLVSQTMASPHETIIFSNSILGAAHSDGFVCEFTPTRYARGGSSLYQGPSRGSMFSGARRGH